MTFGSVRARRSRKVARIFPSAYQSRLVTFNLQLTTSNWLEAQDKVCLALNRIKLADLLLDAGQLAVRGAAKQTNMSHESRLIARQESSN